MNKSLKLFYGLLKAENSFLPFSADFLTELGALVRISPLPDISFESSSSMSCGDLPSTMISSGLPVTGSLRASEILLPIARLAALLGVYLPAYTSAMHSLIVGS